MLRSAVIAVSDLAVACLVLTQNIILPEFLNPLVRLVQSAVAYSADPACKLGEVDCGQVVGKVGGFARAASTR